MTEKLIRRHPHVFGEVEARDVGRGAAQLGSDQARGRGPRALRRHPREPSRACSTRARSCAAPIPRVAARLIRRPRDELEREVGEELLEAVRRARALGVDPELALRAAAKRLLHLASRAASWESSNSIHARQILDSRGNPTVEAEVRLEIGARSAAPRCPRAPRPASSRRPSCATAAIAGPARASRPRSTTSTTRSRRRSTGARATDQVAIDDTLRELDGTPNKSRLGANAILARLACDRAGRGGRERGAALPLRRRALRSDRATRPTCCRCR